MVYMRLNRVIFNRYIPFKGFLMVNLFGVLFARVHNKGKITEIDLNHERIHTAQMKEMLFIGFYIYYLIEWVYLYLVYRDSKWAYRNICFEKEAFKYQDNLDYLTKRNRFEWLHYTYPATITLLYSMAVLFTVSMFWIFT